MRNEFKRTGMPLWRRVTTFLPALLPAALGFLLFSSTGHDDSYITDWVARALAHSGEIVNFNGERVEQSSSLAHVLILASFIKLTGLPAPVLGVLSSIVFGCLSVWLTGRLARQVVPNLEEPARWVTGSATALVYWSFGGLETTLAACAYTLVALSLVRGLRDNWSVNSLIVVAGGLILTAMSRPESPLVVGAVLLGFLAASFRRFRSHPADKAAAKLSRIAWPMLIGGLVVAALLAWRMSYFGNWFPQPVVAKAGHVGVRAGVRYLVGHAFTPWGGILWILAVSGSCHQAIRVIRAQRIEEGALIPALFVAAGLSFVVLSGGDWMNGGRFLVPFLPVAAVTSLTLLRAIPVGLRSVALLTIIGLQFAGTVAFARNQSTGSPMWTVGSLDNPARPNRSWFESAQRINYRDLAVGDRLVEVIASVRARTGRSVVVLSGQMGAGPYLAAVSAFGTVRFIDRYGLTSADFTNCAVTNSAAHGSFGLTVSYAFIFRHLEALRRDCGLDEPDIISDLDQLDLSTSRLIASYGYRVVYQQGGPILNGSQWLPGETVMGESFIAVRDDLSEGLGYPMVHFGR